VDWLTVNAPGGIPWVLALYISDSVHKAITSWNLSLSKVLRYTKMVTCNGFEVFYLLCDYNGLWEVIFNSLIMESLSGSIEDPLFSISKSMLSWFKLPVVISLFLLAWREVSMGLPVHSMSCWIIGDVSTAHGVQDVFGVFESRSWHTISHNATISLIWPIITSAITHAEGLSNMRLILVLLDVVKFIS